MKKIGLLFILVVFCISFDAVTSSLTARREKLIVDGRELRNSEWTYGCDDYCWSKRDCYIGYCYTFHPGVILTLDRTKWKCTKDEDCGAEWECGTKPYFNNICSIFGTEYNKLWFCEKSWVFEIKMVEMKKNLEVFVLIWCNVAKNFWKLYGRNEMIMFFFWKSKESVEKIKKASKIARNTAIVASKTAGKCVVEF